MELTEWVLRILAALAAPVLAVYVFKHWAKKEWGALFSFLIGTACVVFIIVDPDAAIDALTPIGEMAVDFVQNA